MNSDSLSTFGKRVETSHPLHGIPLERGDNHFVNLPKDVLELLEQGKIEQALALLKITRGEEDTSGVSFWVRLQNLFFSVFSIRAMQKNPKLDKSSIAGKKFKTVVIKVFHLLLHIPLSVLKSFVFFFRMGKKASDLMNTSLATLHQYSLQLGKSLLHIGKNFLWHPLQKITAPFVAKCQQIEIKLSEAWEVLRNTTNAMIKKIKQKNKELRTKINDFLRPIGDRIQEFLEPVVKFFKDSAHQAMHSITQTAHNITQNIVMTVQPVINLLAGFIMEKKEALRDSFQQMRQRFGKMAKSLQHKGERVASRVSRTIFDAFASSVQFFYQKFRSLFRWLVQKILPPIGRGVIFLWNIFAKVIFIASCIVIQIGKALLWFIIQSKILERWGIVQISRKLSAIFR